MSPRSPFPKLPPSPLEQLRGIMRQGREQLEKAGEDIRALAGDIHGALPPTTLGRVDSPTREAQEPPTTAPQTASRAPESEEPIITTRNGEDIATACLPCSVGHFSACAGLLNEAARFKKEGLTSNQVMDDVGKCIMELNALERVDLTPEKIQTTKGWERPIAEEALQQSRNLRHRLESVENMEELEQIAADTQRYYTQLNRQWYRGRFSFLGEGKTEAISRRVGEETPG